MRNILPPAIPHLDTMLLDQVLTNCLKCAPLYCEGETYYISHNVVCISASDTWSVKGVGPKIQKAKQVLESFPYKIAKKNTSETDVAP